VDELPDAEVKAGKLCGLRERCPGFGGDGGASGPIANGSSMSSIDMIWLQLRVVVSAWCLDVGSP
jgi:hypothetical protein